MSGVAMFDPLEGIMWRTRTHLRQERPGKRRSETWRSVYFMVVAVIEDHRNSHHDSHHRTEYLVTVIIRSW